MVVASDASSGTRELTQETGTSWLDREVVPSVNVHARFAMFAAAELAMFAAAELVLSAAGATAAALRSVELQWSALVAMELVAATARLTTMVGAAKQPAYNMQV